MEAGSWRLCPLTDVRERLLTASHYALNKGPGSFPESKQISSLVIRPSCSKCPGFLCITQEEFREHCKTEWHLYNLKQGQLSPKSFEDWSLGGDIDEEDCCDESSDESLVENPYTANRLMINSIPFTVADSGQYGYPSVLPCIDPILNAPYVSVLLIRSGRFAGAVWDRLGNNIVHTCFKRYTVRRKNGGAQSKNDSKGAPANSVGAQIRRAQEQKLAEEVWDLVINRWRKYFAQSETVVFAYSSKSQSDTLFVGPLSKRESSCIVLPVSVSVRDPTYAEVCRVYKILTSVAFPS